MSANGLMVSRHVGIRVDGRDLSVLAQRLTAARFGRVVVPLWRLLGRVAISMIALLGVAVVVWAFLGFSNEPLIAAGGSLG